MNSISRSLVAAVCLLGFSPLRGISQSPGDIAIEPDPLARPAAPVATPEAPVRTAPAASKAPEAAPGDGDFVRYVEGADRQQLQTGVVRYMRGDRIVDLVGAVHLADPAYFDALNTQLAQYDAVLYELVGGEFATRDQREADPEIARVQAAHGLINKVLGMEYQTEGIDYDRDNFIHADIDWSQYRELSEARQQSLATLFERAMAVAEGEDAPAFLTDEAAGNAILNKLVTGLTTGNVAELKRAVAPFLSEAEVLIERIEGDDGTVLITERNKVVMDVLGRTLDSGLKHVAIFYGAGHLPDIEQRLLAQGFRKDEGVWLTAWDIVDAAPGQARNLWQDLFADPQVIQSLIGNVQEMLKQLQEGAGAGAETGQ